MIMDIPVKTRTTFAEYDATSESNHFIELIDGEVIEHPVNDYHQRTLIQLVFTLYPVMTKGKPCLGPTGLLFDDGNSFEPDLFWVSKDNPNCVLGADGRYWHGGPDLVVEVLSPSTELNDRGHKFQTYQKYGVREYWMVNPEAKFVEVYVLDSERLIQQGIYDADQSFVSAVLGQATINPKTWFSE
jgi:Uma2 family endonuclease